MAHYEEQDRGAAHSNPDAHSIGPVVVPVASGGTGDRMLADIAKKRYADIKRIYRPIEDSYIDRVLGFNTEQAMDRLAGQGAITAEQGMAPAVGVRPYSVGSGKMLNERVMAAIARGGARTAAATGANLAAENRGTQALAGLVRFGQGQGEQGTAALGREAALRSSVDIANANATAQSKLARDQAIGSVAGTAGSLYYLRGRSPDLSGMDYEDFSGGKR